MALLAVGGCSHFAKVPPTPAKNVDVCGLEEPPPGENFYVTFFGSEGALKLPRFTHTWATVAHVSQRCPERPELLEQLTISWLPAALIIRPWHFHPETGVNLGLHETIAYVLGNREHISQWGPYECRPRTYRRFQVQKDFLESGQIGYQCIDDVGEPFFRGNASDCIHAVTDMDPRYWRGRYPLTRWGEVATEYIVKQFWELDSLIGRDQTYESWLNALLCLDRYPFTARRYPAFVPKFRQA
jgi:hypothetical protein